MARERAATNGRIESYLRDQRSGSNVSERTVAVVKEEDGGYGLTVSGDNPVFVQSIKEDGAAARAGVQAGDRIVMVNDRCVAKLGHTEVVELIRTAKVVNLRLLGKPSLKNRGSLPSLSQLGKSRSASSDQLISSPIDPPARDKKRAVELRSSTIERMLKQEQQFNKDRCDEYVKSPSTKLEKEIQDSTGRIKTLERQLSFTGEGPVASQAASTSDESSTAAVHSTERHPVANSTDRNSMPLQRRGSAGSVADVRKGTPLGKRKKMEAGEKKSRRLRLPGFRGSQTSDSPSPKMKNISSSVSQPSLISSLSNGHTVGVNGESHSQKPLSMTRSAGNISPDSVANICMDESDEDEELDDDSGGPFSDLSFLLKLPAHLAVFLNYLISDSSNDPSNLFFYLVSGVYQRHQVSKDLRRMANDLYMTFFVSTAPLKLDVDPSVVRQIESMLKLKSSSDATVRSLFNKARECMFIVVNQQLTMFRAKRALGLGSMFGDTSLSGGSSRNNHVEVVGQLLLPHLQQLTINHGNESAERKSRREAMASCLVVILQDVGVKMKLKSDSSQLPNFTNSAKVSNKGGGLFKNKKVHLINGHEFVANHYHYPTFCDHCDGLLWGFGFQGYQCQVCGFNVHKQSCNDVLTRACVGPGRKISTVRIGSLWVDLSKRKRTSTKRSTGSRPFSEADVLQVSDGFCRRDDEEFDPSLLRAGSQKDGRVTALVKSYEQKRGETGPSIHIAAAEAPAVGATTAEDDTEAEMTRSRGYSLSVFRGGSEKPHKEKKGQIGRSRSLKLPDSEKNRFHLHRYSGSSDHSVSMINLRQEESSTDEIGKVPRSPSLEDQEIMQDEDMAVDETCTPWADLVDKSVMKDLSPMEIKRQEAIHELVHTERTHLKKLKTLYYVFYIPLQSSKHLTAAKVEGLFPHLLKIIEIHRYVLRGMRERYNQCQMHEETRGRLTSIGDIMLGLFDSQLGEELIEACSEFVSNQTSSLEFIKATRSKSKDFDRLIQRCEAKPICSRLQIGALMSTVMSRLTKYPLLLEKLLKYTDENDPDHVFVENALDASKEALIEVNEQVAVSENQQFLKEIQRKLDTSPLEKAALQLQETKNFSLIADGRELVYDGHLSWRIVKNRTTNVYALLLSDVLVLLEHNEDKDKYLLKPRPDPNIKADRSPIVTFRDLLVRDVATDGKAFFVLSTSSGGPQIHELVAHTVTERETWILKLREAADAWKRGEKNGGTGQRVTLERRRKSTPEKLVEPPCAIDSEEDVLETEPETTVQIQERLRRQTDFIARALEKKMSLMQRLRDSLSIGPDQPEVNCPSQPEQEDLVQEPVVGMSSKILRAVEQADVITGLVNQLPISNQGSMEEDTVQQPNYSLLQALLSSTSELNSRLARLLETAAETSLTLSEHEDAPEKRGSLQRPRSRVISESPWRNSVDSLSPPVLSPSCDQTSPTRQRRISPTIRELQHTLEQQLTPTSSPVLERKQSSTSTASSEHPTETEESTKTAHVDDLASDSVLDTNAMIDESTPSETGSVHSEDRLVDGQGSVQLEDTNDAANAAET